MEITPREGIQADFSFHQHGAQLYTGAYGLGFLMDSVRMAGLLDGTPWSYEPQRLEILAAFALDGVRPLVRGRWLDWGARGREFTRVQQRVSRPQAALPALRTLADLPNSRRDELAAFALYIEQGAKSPPLLGNRHFWRSDFMVHQTAKGYWSVKMMSARTVGTESGNGENLRGFWLPFGTTYLAAARRRVRRPAAGVGLEPPAGSDIACGGAGLQRAAARRVNSLSALFPTALRARQP